MGSCLVATDGLMKDVYDFPLGKPELKHDNPSAAAIEFVEENPDFVIEVPAWSFRESELKKNMTYWPDVRVERLR